MPKKVAIFGGTGMTGVCAVKEALDMGKVVRLLVRNESRIPDEFKQKVEVVVGDVTNISDVEKTLSGVDQVVVVLGTRNCLKPTTELSTGLKNIVDSMSKEGLKQISVCLSAFLFSDPKDVPSVFINIDSEHRRMLEVLKEKSDLDWIAVFPPHIQDGKISKTKITLDAHCGIRVVSKQNLGYFMVSCVENPEFYRHLVSIADDV